MTDQNVEALTWTDKWFIFLQKKNIVALYNCPLHKAAKKIFIEIVENFVLKSAIESSLWGFNKGLILEF